MRVILIGSQYAMRKPLLAGEVDNLSTGKSQRQTADQGKTRVLAQPGQARGCVKKNDRLSRASWRYTINFTGNALDLTLVPQKVDFSEDTGFEPVNKTHGMNFKGIALISSWTIFRSHKCA